MTSCDEACRAMELHPVESSMIGAAGYDEDAQTMDILFNSGKVYRYFDVPKEVYEELMAADSKGRYMRDAVIDCYSTAQITKRKRR